VTDATIITSAEVARILGRSQSTVNRQAAAGELPTVGEVEGRTGPRLFRRADIERMAAELKAAS
jgi:predicted DNA-binding transcriptional regulator AlpA